MITKITVAVTVLFIFAGFFFFWLSGKHPQVSAIQAVVRCLPCHIETKLQKDGLVASRFSRGTHPINKEKIRPRDIPLEATYCGKCHPFEYQSWLKSNHAMAYTNPVFAHAVLRDKHSWCLNCHIPLWSGEKAQIPALLAYLLLPKDQQEKNMPFFLKEGVNCAVCHVRDGEIIGSGQKAQSALGEKHNVKIDPQLSTEKACEGCHQFNYPLEIDPVIMYELKNPMQNVVAEHLNLRKTGNEKSCVHCHFWEKDHSLHQLESADLRNKFQVQMLRDRENPRKLLFRLQSPRIGHHYPTGDLFRTIRILLFDKKGDEIYRQDFRKEVRVVDRYLVQDTTLRPPQVGKSIYYEQFIETKVPAYRCEVNYHLQANIEPTLIKEGIDLKSFIRPLAPCEIKIK